MPVRPAAILFACNLNRVRSPMAAALAQSMGLIADSCGLLAADEIDPFAAAVMAEIGADLTAHAPKAFEAVPAGAFDLVVSLTPEAHRRAEANTTMGGPASEFWPIDDPTLASGSREQRLEAYRAVRQDLKRRLAARFGQAST